MSRIQEKYSRGRIRTRTRTRNEKPFFTIFFAPSRRYNSRRPEARAKIPLDAVKLE